MANIFTQYFLESRLDFLSGAIFLGKQFLFIYFFIIFILEHLVIVSKNIAVLESLFVLQDAKKASK